MAPIPVCVALAGMRLGESKHLHVGSHQYGLGGVHGKTHPLSLAVPFKAASQAGDFALPKEHRAEETCIDNIWPL